ncbi:hypothetical protein DTO271D3_7016 [Paecilomyces variotii]|nr:hypothetical protein DTO271D3_7016 [Paecilomyces variotii]
MSSSEGSEEDSSGKGDLRPESPLPSPRTHDKMDSYKYQLYESILRGSFERVKSLIDAGVDINQPFAGREPLAEMVAGPPIYHAAVKGAKLTRLLIDAGAEVDQQYGLSGTALQRAADTGDYETMELLLDAGANANATPGAGKTALSRAILSSIDPLKKVQLLLHHGADVNGKDSHGTTPLDDVFESRRLEFAPLLIARGANVMTAARTWQRCRAEPLPSFWLHLNRHQPYRTLDEAFTSIVGASLALDVVRVIQMDWEIPKLLKAYHSGSSREDSDSGEDILSQHWKEQFVLVANALEISGTSCTEFVSRRWGKEGYDILQCLVDNIHLACRAPGEVVKIVLAAHLDARSCYYIHSLSVDHSCFKLWLDPGITKKSLGIISGVVSFVGKAIRTSRTPEKFALTSMEPRLEVDLEDLTNIDRSLVLKLCLKEEPFQNKTSDCWQHLFIRGVIAKDEIIATEARSKGKGLRVSYDHMVMISSVRYSVRIHDTIILLGYRTALIATEIHEDFVQYHAEVSERGQINPYCLDLKVAASVKSISELERRHCYIGWCTEANIRAGTEGLVTGPLPYLSRTRPKKKSLHVDGIAAGIQATTASPFQAGLNLGITGKFVVNRVQFDTSRIYSELLRDTSRNLVLLYDSGSRIGWLLPKLSLLVHMSHIYLKKLTGSSNVPFLPDHIDTEDIVRRLENQGNLVLFGREESQTLFQDLMLRLNTNMLSSAERTDESTSRTFYGHEFLDIVLPPERGAWMKQVRVKRNARDLLRIAGIVDAVVIGDNLGKIIQPRTFQDSCACCTVPSGYDYVVAPVTCLERLASDHGETNVLFRKLGNSTYWAISSRPFQARRHLPGGSAGYWYQIENFQRVTSNIPESAGMSNGTAVPTNPPMGGAVVFGKPIDPNSKPSVFKLPNYDVFGQYKRFVQLFKQ